MCTPMPHHLYPSQTHRDLSVSNTILSKSHPCCCSRYAPLSVSDTNPSRPICIQHNPLGGGAEEVPHYLYPTQNHRDLSVSNTTHQNPSESLSESIRIPKLTQCRLNVDQNLMKFCPFGMIFRPKFRSRRDLSHCTLRIRLSQGIYSKTHQHIRVDLIHNPYFVKNSEILAVWDDF